MSHNNQLTVKRHRKELSDMIIDIMQDENVSLLQAYVKLAGMVTSDEVINLTKDKIKEMQS